jgi:hypothetical protein
MELFGHFLAWLFEWSRSIEESLLHLKNRGAQKTKRPRI